MNERIRHGLGLLCVGVIAFVCGQLLRDIGDIAAMFVMGGFILGLVGLGYLAAGLLTRTG